MSIRRGQLNSIDLFLALFIFVLILVFITGFFNVAVRDADRNVKKTILESSATSISELLVKTPGVPENWERDSLFVSTIGLASSQNVLSKNKLSNFTEMNYASAKSTLGLAYEFFFLVQDLANNTLYSSGNSSYGRQSASVTRYALLDGEIVSIRVAVHD